MNHYNEARRTWEGALNAEARRRYEVELADCKAKAAKRANDAVGNVDVSALQGSAPRKNPMYQRKAHKRLYLPFRVGESLGAELRDSRRNNSQFLHEINGLDFQAISGHSEEFSRVVQGPRASERRNFRYNGNRYNGNWLSESSFTRSSCIRLGKQQGSEARELCSQSGRVRFRG